MCEPTTIAMAAFSIVKAGVGFISQQQQADKQQAYEVQRRNARTEQMYANAQAAKAAQVEDYASNNQRLVEEEEAASAELFAAQIDEVQAAGEARARMASSEQAGLSTRMIMRDIGREAARFESDTRYNLTSTQRQIAKQQDGVQAQAQNRINSIQPYGMKPVKRPSLLGAVGEAAGGVLGAYNSYSSSTPTTDYTGGPVGGGSSGGGTSTSRNLML